MPSFHNGDVEIAFYDEGEGEPIVLVHGFASSAEVNWFFPGWVSTLTKAGRRVIALDNRGHGASQKLYDPEQYNTGIMSGDVIVAVNDRPVTTIDQLAELPRGARLTVERRGQRGILVVR